MSFKLMTPSSGGVIATIQITWSTLFFLFDKTGF